MATLVYQGLQTCLDNEPRTLRLRLASPKPHFSQSLELAMKSSCSLDSNTKLTDANCQRTVQSTALPENKPLYTNPDRGGWGCFQDLFNSCKDAKDKEDEAVYVHPSMKRSASCLSEESLQMCTENLGNETGSDMAESSIFSSLDSYRIPDSRTRQQPKSCQPSGTTRKVISRDFPPPLSTISGSESLQVRPYREDGRLVIKAVKAPSSRTCFQAERIDGRLKLSFLKDYTPQFESNEAAAAEENEEIYDEEEFEDHGDEDESDQECCMELEEDVNENKINVGAGMKIEKFRRPCSCRCKEGDHENKALLNWEPFWVAT